MVYYVAIMVTLNMQLESMVSVRYDGLFQLSYVVMYGVEI